ncbi:metallophosphoesterase [Chelativorans sp. SCAU2101]|jgi:Predicted phosphoesterases, related to the Icc protein|uniref:Metallophosphoesterase n=1 Tax=Chelativorans petroleitrophicus TaxID=2975484 RepID=A0A9X2XBF8_9HYPH|nr:metallophosphoesterase [Chelativorans petroleitrophicus]MCT8992094.1 metallophosphoesterase [Chelativorans petroleitrophicus]
MKIAAIADLHVREDASVSHRAMFNEIGREADILVLAGDLTDLGKPREAELLAEDLRGCGIPVVGVLGNHDHECNAVEDVTHVLREAGMHLLDGQSVELKGVGFAGVKGFAGGFGRRMLASFGEPAIKAMVAESVNEAMKLENALRQLSAERVVAIVHYAPIEETVSGEPLEIYPFLGSSRLAETIDRFPVNAVVHGHAHHGVYEGRTPGGVRVFNVAQRIEKPSGKPYAILEI